MKYEFIDEETVKITAALEWYPGRPPIDLRKVVKNTHYIDKFCEENPNYNIVSVAGPPQIYNFRSEGDSKGVWILEVMNKQQKIEKPKAIVKEKPKAVSKKTSKKKTRKEGF